MSQLQVEDILKHYSKKQERIKNKIIDLNNKKIVIKNEQKIVIFNQHIKTSKKIKEGTNIYYSKDNKIRNVRKAVYDKFKNCKPVRINNAIPIFLKHKLRAFIVQKVKADIRPWQNFEVEHLENQVKRGL